MARDATVNVRTQEAIEVLAVCLHHKEKLIAQRDGANVTGPSVGARRSDSRWDYEGARAAAWGQKGGVRYAVFDW